MLASKFLKTISVKSNVQPYHVCKPEYAIVSRVLQNRGNTEVTEQV